MEHKILDGSINLKKIERKVMRLLTIKCTMFHATTRGPRNQPRQITSINADVVPRSTLTEGTAQR